MDKRTSGFGTRGSVLGLFVLLSVAGGCSSSAFGEDSSSFGKVSGARITVLVFNYAELSHETFAQSQIEASRIFARAAVAVEWLGCRFSAADAIRPAACEEPLGPTDFVVRILPRRMEMRQAFRQSLGITVLPAEGARGSMASVFYERVEELAKNGLASRSQVLGHAVAHEIGHLLLRSGAHAHIGIMRAYWDRQELREAAQRSLLFTPEQSERVRAEVRERSQGQASRQSSEVPTPM